jgi:hypothetical protein
MEISSRQRARRIRALTGRSGLNPMQELTHNHHGTYSTPQNYWREYRWPRLIKRSA